MDQTEEESVLSNNGGNYLESSTHSNNSNMSSVDNSSPVFENYPQTQPTRTLGLNQPSTNTRPYKAPQRKARQPGPKLGVGVQQTTSPKSEFSGCRYSLITGEPAIEFPPPPTGKEPPSNTPKEAPQVASIEARDSTTARLPGIGRSAFARTNPGAITLPRKPPEMPPRNEMPPNSQMPTQLPTQGRCLSAEKCSDPGSCRCSVCENEGNTQLPDVSATRGNDSFPNTTQALHYQLATFTPQSPIGEFNSTERNNPNDLLESADHPCLAGISIVHYFLLLITVPYSSTLHV